MILTIKTINMNQKTFMYLYNYYVSIVYLVRKIHPESLKEIYFLKYFYLGLPVLK